MAGRLFGGTGRWRDKYRDIVPDSEEMMIWAQNASDQFTDPRLSALNSEDAMERYQQQVAKTSTPEIRVPQEDDKVLEGRKRAHMLINRLANGGPRGPRELAYKPELTQSNVSTYTYSVPSTDPIIANRGKDGNYYSDAYGNTVYRMTLPNRQTNAELSTRMFNTQNRIAKYAANVKKVENTSRIVDFVPQRKDNTWGDRVLDTIRHRLMPPKITMEDNGDGFNREKNKCRDTDKVAYRYRHKEYDTDIQLSEVLDGNKRIKPEIGPMEGDGTPIGNLVAELAKGGNAKPYLDSDIYFTTKNIDARRGNNPNKNKHTQKSTFAEEFPGVDEKDGGHAKIRIVNNESVRNNVFGGLDPVRQAILGAEAVEEVIRSSKKTAGMRARRKNIVNNSTTADDGYNVDEDGNGIKATIRKIFNKGDDADRKILLTQIPGLQQLYEDRVLLGKNNKMVPNTSGQKRGVTVRDGEFPLTAEDDNNTMNKTGAKRLFNDTDNGQGVRGLIKDLVKDSEFNRLNAKLNPNTKNKYKDGKIVKRGVNHSELLSTPENTEFYSLRHNKAVAKSHKRPMIPGGINMESQLEFSKLNKPLNKKRVRIDPVGRARSQMGL